MTRSPTRRRIIAGISTAAVGLAGCAGNDRDPDPPDDTEGDSPDVADADFEVETVVEGLEQPWGIEFVPGARELLLTERESGRLLHLDREEGTFEPLSGTPEIHSGGQGGLFDIALHPSYPEQRWVYLTYSASNTDGETSTHLGRGRLDREEERLAGFEELFVAEPFVDSTAHYGSRVVFGEDGMAYVTVGDRGDKRFGDEATEHYSQVTTNELGATLRLEPDGSIPDDNPFVEDDDFADAIFSYGHRNAQGMAVHPETGELWQSEHGERDGDEINIIEEGGNYGWPVTHYGCEYGTDDPVGDQPHEHEDVVDPVFYWECTSGGFPPAGATFYDCEAFPSWQGDLFVGGLASQSLAHFAVDGREVTFAEHQLDDRGWRIRDVAAAPDTGHLYVVVDDGNASLVRLVTA